MCMTKERNTFKEKKKPAQMTKKDKHKAKKAKQESMRKTSPEVNEIV